MLEVLNENINDPVTCVNLADYTLEISYLDSVHFRHSLNLTIFVHAHTNTHLMCYITH